MTLKNIVLNLSKISYLTGSDKKKLFWLVPLFLLSSILDLIGIGLVVLCVSLISSSDGLEQSSLYLLMPSFEIGLDDHLIMIGLSLVLFIVFLTKTITAILVNKTILSICFKFGVKLRSFLMNAYQNMDYLVYRKRNSSEYVHNIQIMVGQFTNGTVQSILRILSDGIVVAVIIIFLAFNSGLALAILIILLVLVFLTYDKLFKIKIMRYGSLSNFFSTRMVQGISEGMKGYRENHIFGTTNYFNYMVTSAASGLAESKLRSTVITGSSRYIVELVLVSFVVLLIIISSLIGEERDQLLVTISMFAIASMRLMPSANQLLGSFNRIRFGQNSLEILYRDFKQIEADDGSMQLRSFDLSTRLKMPAKKTAPVDTFQDLVLQDVFFSYPDAEENALENISLTIRKGDSIGIIGTSGSGKSTLVDVILGLLRPECGTIEFNGNQLAGAVEAWYSQVAYLPQDIFLVDDNILNNIALGESQPDLDRVMRAVRRSRLEDLVNELPDGLLTNIGERGIRLSGGQRQRIALARAFYHDRQVFVLDESTSALDNETEREIVREINSLKGKKTLIVVAHRLSTLEHCDVIYRLNSGKIVESGDFHNVIQKGE